MKKISILLADDHSLMRMGLRSLIATAPDMTIVAEAGNGEDAVRLAGKLGLDVVVMDLMMPGLSGAEATALIRRDHPDVHVLILTTYGTSQELFTAIDNGAEGVMLNHCEKPLTVAVTSLDGGFIPETAREGFRRRGYRRYENTGTITTNAPEAVMRGMSPM